MPEQRALLLDDPWQVDTGGFPEAGEPQAKLLFLANYGVLAPSILNVQPWRFRIADGSMDLLADRSRALPVVDPEGRELTISCGAALLNLRVAAGSFGYELHVATIPDPADPDLLARTKLLKARRPSKSDQRLRDAIPVRRTHRAPFENRRPDRDLLDQIAEAAREENAALAFIDRAEDKRSVADLVAEAERIHLTDPDFRRELSDWINQRVAEGHCAPDETRWGMGGPAGHSPRSSDRPDLFTQTAADVAREFASPDSASAHQHASAEASPVLALLSTNGDTAADWLAAGQALQRALLTAAAEGLSASYLNPPTELIELRRKLASVFGGRGDPQVLLRFGFGGPVPPSPRRPVSDIVEW